MSLPRGNNTVGLYVRRMVSAGMLAALCVAILPPLPVFAAQANADALVGYWKLDETATPTFTDSSGDNHTGTGNGSNGSNNTPQPSATVPSAIVFSNARSLHFDGSDDYVSFGDHDAYTLTNATFAVWVRFDSIGSGNEHVFFGKRDVGNTATEYQFGMNAAGNLKLSFPSSGTNCCTDVTETTTVFSTGTWYHVAASFDGAADQVKWYVNGTNTETDTTSLSFGTNTSTILTLGSSMQGSGEWHHGNLDDARIYNRVLSSTEITDLAGGTHTRATWDGSSGKSFEHGSNWDTNAVPDPFTRLTIPATANWLTLTGAVKFSSLTINTGALMRLNGTGVTVNDAGVFTNYGTLALRGNETLTNFTSDSTKGTILVNGTGSYTGLPTGVTYHNLTLNDGLTGYWKFDETSGIRALDASGYGSSGTLINGPVASATVSPVRFYNPRSILFDGSTEYISVTTNDVLDMVNTDMTFAAWIYMTGGADTYRIVVSKNDSLANNPSYEFGVGHLNKLYFYQANAGVGGQIRSLTSPSLNAWHHVAFVFRNASKTGTFYLDGLEDGKGTGLRATRATSNPLYIGVDAPSGTSENHYFNGNIDDLRMYNRALQVGEIAALAAGNQPSTARASITLNGALDINNDLVLNSGTLDVSSSNYGVTVGGSFLNHGGVFNARKGTVTLDGSTSALQILSGGQRFNALTLNGSAATWTLRDRLTASGTLALSNGTLDVSSTGDYTVRAGTVSQTSGTFTARSGIVALTSPASRTATITSTLNALHIEDPTEQGLVGYWKLDEGTNSGSILDASGYGNTGVRRGSGALVWTGSVLPSTIDFENPFAMQFNGIRDHVSAGTNGFNTGTSARSIAGWIRADSSATTRVPFAYGDCTTAGKAFGLYLSTSNVLNFWGCGSADFSTATTLVAGTWYHVAATYNGTHVRVYVNGSQVGSTTARTLLSSTAYMEIGGAHLLDSGNYYFPGLVDDLRVYNRALTASEIRNLASGVYADGANGTATFTLGANLDLSTMTILSGIVGGSTRTIDVSGDWNNFAGSGAFTAGTSTVDLDGTSTQNIRGSTNFSTFEISTNTARTVNVSSGSLLGVADALIFTGAASALLTLAPLDTGYEWLLDLGNSATQSVSYVSVSYSNASGGLAILASNSTDGGNTTNWTFASATGTDDGGYKGAARERRERAFSEGGGDGGGSVAAGTGGTVTAFVPDYVPLGKALREAQENAREATAFVAPDPRRVTAIRDALLDRFRSQMDLVMQREREQQAAQEAFLKEGVHASAEERRFAREQELARRATDEQAPTSTAQIAARRGLLLGVVAGKEVLYRDVSIKAWYAPYVALLIEEQVVEGYKDADGQLTGEFGVEQSVTYAEILKIALEASKTAVSGSVPRNRFAQGTWASGYVGTAEDLQLRVFTPDLDVHTPATRGEVIHTILEVLQIPTAAKSPSPFTDVPEDHPFAPAIAVAALYGLISGDDGTNAFRPDEPINRAEVAKIIALTLKLTE